MFIFIFIADHSQVIPVVRNHASHVHIYPLGTVPRLSRPALELTQVASIASDDV